MINQLHIPLKNKFYESYLFDGRPLKKLPSISKINFFIGVNNSGKSRFLRALLKDFHAVSDKLPAGKGDLRHIKLRTKDDLKLLELPYNDILPDLQTISDTIKKGIKNETIKKKLDTLLDKHTNLILDENIIFQFHAEIKDFIQSLNQDFNKNDLTDPKSNEVKRKNFLLYHFEELLKVLRKYFPLKNGFKCTYVPAFRSLRKLLTFNEEEKEKEKSYNFLPKSKFDYCAPIDDHLISNRIFVDYFVETKSQNGFDGSKYEILLDQNEVFTGESLFETIRTLRNSGEDQRVLLEDYEEFLGQYFFNGQTITLNALEIDAVKDVFIKIGQDKEFPIYRLGDGIQAIILLTFPLFANKGNNHLIFYEEPELYLHPGMQRLFVEVLNSFSQTQSFIATHSNHFLDTTIDYPEEISIYSLKNVERGRDPKFSIELLSSPGVSILNELGVRNSSVLLANCSIWVEGVSDRMYLKKYLDLYQLSIQSENNPIPLLKEDMHYVFLEFGGNNITHYDFSLDDADLSNIKAKSISNRIFLVHDSDTGKEKRHQKLKKQLHDNYYKLDVLEMENLLSPKVLKNTLLSFTTNKISTAIQDFRFDEYRSKPLGVFVSELSVKGLRKIFNTAKGKQVPKLYNKVEFAHKALAHINCWDDLTPNAKKITEALYHFITRNN